MTTYDIAEFAKLTIRYETSVNPELMEMGFHTGLRADTGKIDDLMDDVEVWMAAMSTASLLAGLTTRFVVYSVWGTGPGYTGWHQVRSRPVSSSLGSGDRLPPQLAAVVSLRNTSELAIPIGRRRNRTYHGPMATSVLGTDGRLSGTFCANLATAWSNLETTLEADVDAVPINPVAGLAIVSPTHGVGMSKTVGVVGRAVDTHRSRRQKVPEQTASFFA